MWLNLGRRRQRPQRLGNRVRRSGLHLRPHRARLEQIVEVCDLCELLALFAVEVGEFLVFLPQLLVRVLHF